MLLAEWLCGPTKYNKRALWLGNIAAFLSNKVHTSAAAASRRSHCRPPQLHSFSRHNSIPALRGALLVIHEEINSQSFLGPPNAG